ncbi:MAG: winged helix-turn-helix domain-containing protein [Candidatus Omnitrophica bacterium]|nr:winged helix-turn-helix domain-containing protein [Candidatus Omnitrophota bacterium]
MIVGITEIGIVAGEVWHYLDQHGEVSFSVLIQEIGRPRDLALMSVGWLAREGHVIVREDGPHDYRVWLRPR